MGVGTYASPGDVVALFPGTNANVPSTTIATQIANASSAIENYTRRILTLGTYTEETRLTINKDNQIVGIVEQWPIVSLSLLQYRLIGETSFSPLDPTAADITMSPERFFYYDLTRGLPGNPYSGGLNLTRRMRGVLSYTYTAGYARTPGDIILACCYLTQELLMVDANPTGASSIQVGAEGAQNTIAWSGNVSQNVLKAKELLQRYVRWD